MALVKCTFAQATNERAGLGAEIYYKDDDPIETFMDTQHDIVYKLDPKITKATFLAHWPEAKPCIDIS
jgi:hypothetical protein